MGVSGSLPDLPDPTQVNNVVPLPNDASEVAVRRWAAAPWPGPPMVLSFGLGPAGNSATQSEPCSYCPPA